jgi:hypothetical protein
MTTTSRGSSRAQMMPRLQVWGRAVGISGIRDMLVQVVDDWWRILANSDINTMDGKDNKPFKQCTTTSNSPFASSASSSSVQMLLESKAEKDLTWFSSAIVLTTVETYSMSGDARWRALSCWMMDSTWAMASWERRVPMLILVMGLVLVLVPLPESVVVAIFFDSRPGGWRLPPIAVYFSC